MGPLLAFFVFSLFRAFVILFSSESNVMQRRQKWKWIIAGGLFCAGASIVWLVFFQNDDDIRWIGPRSNQIREIETWLAKPVEMSHFRQPGKLRATLEKMYELHATGEAEVTVLVDQCAFEEAGFLGRLYDMEIAFSDTCASMSRRQFFQAILRQVPSNNAVILIRHSGWLEMTTTDRARLERDYYWKSNGITLFDTFRQRFAEMRGVEGPMPIPSIEGDPRLRREEEPS